MIIDEDRRVVITTLNGNIIDHRIFEDQRQAYAGYSESVNKMRSILQNSNDDGDWEILLCDVKQYALSRPNEEVPRTDLMKTGMENSWVL